MVLQVGLVNLSEFHSASGGVCAPLQNSFYSIVLQESLVHLFRIVFIP
jgi:hypothetical protein